MQKIIAMLFGVSSDANDNSVKSNISSEQEDIVM
jgi:hypothetical protein